MVKYTIPWLTKSFTGIDIPYPVPPYDVLVFLDDQGRAIAINKHAEVIAVSEDHAEVMKKVIENYDGVIWISQIEAEVYPMKLRDNQTIILDRCKFALKAGSNDSMFKIYDEKAKIISFFSELNGNKDNQTAEPSSGIRVLANDGAYAEAEIEGILYIHDFRSQGIDIVATSTSRAVAGLNGIIKTYNNGRNGIYVGYNGELYHNGYIDTYGNGSVEEGDGVTVGDIGNKVVLDKVYAHDNARAGMSIWKTNYVKINFLEAYNNKQHGLYIERNANHVEVDFIIAYNNAYDGIYIINGTENPYGSKKNIFIRGVVRNNSRNGITLSFDDIDMESVFLDIVSHDNNGRGIYTSGVAGYYVKNSVVKIVSVGNGSSDELSGIDKQTTRLFYQGAITTKTDIGDFGGGFTNYTPSPAVEGAIVIAIDTNSSNSGKRIYVRANGEWHYVDLT